MASTTTTLDTTNITKAKAAVNAYKTTCTALAAKLQGVIDGLYGTGFVGWGADGYKFFYDQVKPALTTNLIGDDQSLTSMLNQIIDVVAAMLDPVDPQIKAANTNALNNQQVAAPQVGNVAAPEMATIMQ